MISVTGVTIQEGTTHRDLFYLDFVVTLSAAAEEAVAVPISGESTLEVDETFILSTAPTSVVANGAEAVEATATILSTSTVNSSCSSGPMAEPSPPATMPRDALSASLALVMPH